MQTINVKFRKRGPLFDVSYDFIALPWKEKKLQFEVQWI